MRTTEFTYPSADGQATIHASRWVPEDAPVRGVFQIVHGMQEYINRYERFASFLAAQGFVVTGNDHLGHGGSVAKDDDLGYFTKKNAAMCVVDDAHELTLITKKEYPNVPYFLLGHSMGSFIARKYLCFYGSELTGAIIMGTGMMPGAVTGVGRFLCKFIGLFRGDRHKSPFITNIAFGSYQKRIENPRTEKDWLTHDNAIVDEYLSNKYNMFDFTLNGYHTLFSVLGYVCKKKNLLTIPKDLPIFVCAGCEDPVGNYGDGPTKVAQQYKDLGITDVTLKLYPEMRHEILNEIHHETVDEDILHWLNEHIKG